MVLREQGRKTLLQRAIFIEQKEKRKRRREERFSQLVTKGIVAEG